MNTAADPHAAALILDAKGMPFSDFCRAIGAQAKAARARLAVEATPGSMWSSPNANHMALIVGQLVPGKTRVARLDARGFIGHCDLAPADVPRYLTDYFD